jgi:hypothetical protein
MNDNNLLLNLSLLQYNLMWIGNKIWFKDLSNAMQNEFNIVIVEQDDILLKQQIL